MKRKNDNLTIGDIYGQMLKSVNVVEESCSVCATDNINMSKKTPKMPDNAFNTLNKLQKGGPCEKGGYHKALNDPQDIDKNEDNEDNLPQVRPYYRQNAIEEIEKKLKNPKLSEKQRKSLELELKKLKDAAQGQESEENIQESKKIARNRLNNFMTKKSTFDKIFESIMGDQFEDQETRALVGDAPSDDEMGDDDFGDEDMGDEVTVTLSRDLAQQLHDVLMGVLGDEEDMGDEGDDLDFDDQEDVDFDDQEDEERGVYPTDHVGNDGTVGPKNSKDGPHKLQGKSSKVGGRPQPKNQGTKVVGATDKVGNDGDYGHALHGARSPEMGKQNKVSDLRQSEDYFR